MVHRQIPNDAGPFGDESSLLLVSDNLEGDSLFFVHPDFVPWVIPFEFDVNFPHNWYLMPVIGSAASRASYFVAAKPGMKAAPRWVNWLVPFDLIGQIVFLQRLYTCDVIVCTRVQQNIQPYRDWRRWLPFTGAFDKYSLDWSITKVYLSMLVFWVLVLVPPQIRWYLVGA